MSRSEACEGESEWKKEGRAERRIAPRSAQESKLQLGNFRLPALVRRFASACNRLHDCLCAVIPNCSATESAEAGQPSVRARFRGLLGSTQSTTEHRTWIWARNDTTDRVELIAGLQRTSKRRANTAERRIRRLSTTSR